nr:HAMP domain-containing sensor histidine kinase [Aneurinibacillus sp. XH2]
MKFRHSLLARYLLIVLIALCMWPVLVPLAGLLYYSPQLFTQPSSRDNIYGNGQTIEQMWHSEAAQLDGQSEAAIGQRLQELKEQYPLASMFWVDAAGETKLMLPEQEGLPKRWMPGEIIRFMKDNRGIEADPFTVVALLGRDSNQGFMVIQIPRSLMRTEWLATLDNRILYAIVCSIFVFFLFASWLFFYKIRRRLIRLQEAMTLPDDAGIPRPVEVDKKDEISQLEHSFNHMIGQLTSGRQREQEEEELRKQLIANLSHDIRTPLTTIRGHAYSLHKETLTESGRQSLALIEEKTEYLAQLIENLMSYTLLSAGKYPLQMEESDVIRLTRTSIASWYPVFEKEQIQVEVDLPDKAAIWMVDPQWFIRILDNLLQNVVRHAGTGQYVGIRAEVRNGATAIVIADRGPGMRAASGHKGAGIGLTIVSIMVKEMNLNWDVSSSSEGTVISLYPKRNI